MKSNPSAWAIETAELATAADRVLAENAAAFGQWITQTALSAMRALGADGDAVAAAQARADSVVGEGWEWAWEQEALWRDVMAWVAGEQEACPLPKWAVVP